MTAQEELKGFLHGGAIDTLKQGAAFRRYHELMISAVEEAVAEEIKKATKKKGKK
ncbi:MAG: hypothetical protein ACE5GA_00170 [Candidatus Zixiibacteriota bacterium]